VEPSSSRSFAKSSRPSDSTCISPKSTNSNNTVIIVNNKNDENVFTTSESTDYASVFAQDPMADTRARYTTAAFGRSANTDTITNGPSDTPELRDSSAREANLDGISILADASGEVKSHLQFDSP